MSKSKVMVLAGKKAAATRKANQIAEAKKWSDAGKKAWATRLRNERKAKRANA